MNENQVYCILDYETRSEIDLKKVGAFEYANHSSTQILCVSWRVGTRAELKQQLRLQAQWEAAYRAQYPQGTMSNPHAAKIWSPAFPNEGDLPGELLKFLTNDSIKLVAHNALFEQVITRFVLPKMIPRIVMKTETKINKILFLPHDRWICTASMAAALALPRNLEGACQALSLPVQKDMTGRRLILKYCKPRKSSKTNKAKWHSKARDLRRIMQYCQTDVDAETWLFLTLPPLSEDERQVWLLDQKINFRGFKADRSLVEIALKLIAEETKNLNKETGEITSGCLSTANQRDGVLKWLHREGVFLPDLRAKTVADAIKEGLATGDNRRLLQIRQAISKTSTKKYAAFEARSRTDGRVRDILVYHTASTGRWGGAGVQPQNFPRGTIDDTAQACDVLTTGDLEFIKLVYGSPMDVLSSCLRSVICAPKGRELFCADYAAIEARVLFWIAKHTSGLKAFTEDRPMYEEMATAIYNINYIENVTKLQRQVGKQAFLGCGYGMGWKKFLQTCKNFGIEVDEETSQVAVNAYRSLHAPVVKLWSNFEKVAIEAVKQKGKKFSVNYTTWWVESLPGTDLDFLWCKLPSGRKLAYFGPKLKYEKTPWGDKRAVLYHWGVDPYTKKWAFAGTYGGKLTENVVQAISRDLMAKAMLGLEADKFELILTVHDEILAECQNPDEIKFSRFKELMASTPLWAKGCPVKVEGWHGERYRK